MDPEEDSVFISGRGMFISCCGPEVDDLGGSVESKKKLLKVLVPQAF